MKWYEIFKTKNSLKNLNKLLYKLENIKKKPMHYHSKICMKYRKLEYLLWIKIDCEYIKSYNSKKRIMNQKEF